MWYIFIDKHGYVVMQKGEQLTIIPCIFLLLVIYVTYLAVPTH